MADVVPRRARGVRLVLVIPLLVLVAGALAWNKHKKQQAIDLSKNFVIHYDLPAGWKAAPHGPETLFRVIDPNTRLVLRGAVNQVISEENPTPELDTEGIADYYVDRTVNMIGWKVEKLGISKGKNLEFEVLRRSSKDRVVVTAYSVRGNTTVLVTLLGKGRDMGQVDPNMSILYHFLNTISMQEKDLSNL